jgi:hypothetical protein
MFRSVHPAILELTKTNALASSGWPTRGLVVDYAGRKRPSPQTVLSGMPDAVAQSISGPVVSSRRIAERTQQRAVRDKRLHEAVPGAILHVETQWTARIRNFEGGRRWVGRRLRPYAKDETAAIDRPEQ